MNWISLYLIAAGLFFIVDSLFLHLVTFNYAGVGLTWLDPILNHWVWGIGFLVAGLAVRKRR